MRATLDDAVRLYGKSSTADQILNHPIYATIADSLAGMQELMAVERIDQLARRGFEHIVVDTAPSRHALEFLEKPMFFSELAGSGWVKLVGRTYKLVAGTGMMTLGRKTIDLYARAESILGANLVRQVLDFYSLFVSIAEGYAERAVKTVEMLKDPAITEFRVVTIPQKAVRDAQFFHEELSRRRFPIGALYVNQGLGHRTGPRVSGGSGAPGHGLVQIGASFAGGGSGGSYRPLPQSDSSHRLPPELAQDVDGLGALEKIAKCL